MTTLYTAEQVHELGLLPYKPRTLKDKARDGKIGHVKIGRKYRFRDEDIAAAIAAGAVPAQGAPAATPPRNPRYANR